MKILSWAQIVERFSRLTGGSSPGQRKNNEYARLSLRRLEDRRVLNGAPVTAGVTVEDMKGAVVVNVQGPAPGNHTGHDFKISTDTRQGQIQLELTDHGTILYEAELNKFKSLTIQTNGHNNTLTIDFSNGNPLPHGGLFFVDTGTAAGGASNDVLQIVHGSASSVGYSFDSASAGHIDITSGSSTSTIGWSGSSVQIQDQLLAATRSFSVGLGGQVDLS
ncbi:MAG: hypothetical protein JSS02_25750, partial [Planctomycetes bacterium]|nr:hypothetical protein [Planctomycetota bacterium]